MERAVAWQTTVFLLSAALGGGLALLYDFFRESAIVFKKKRLFRGIDDFIFCLLCLASLLIFMLTAAKGQARGYIFLGAAMGAALYSLAISPLMRRLIRGLMKMILQLFRLVKTGLYLSFTAPKGC